MRARKPYTYTALRGNSLLEYVLPLGIITVTLLIVLTNGNLLDRIGGFFVDSTGGTLSGSTMKARPLGVPMPPAGG